MVTIQLHPLAEACVGHEVPPSGPLAALPVAPRSLALIGLVQLSAGLALVCSRVAASNGAAIGGVVPWWSGPLRVCATVAAFAHVAAGTLLLARRRATVPLVHWTQHAAAWTLAPVFLLGAAATIILGQGVWATGAAPPLAGAAGSVGVCLASGILALMAVRAVRILRRIDADGKTDRAEPGPDGILPYAGPRDGGRVSLRGVNLSAICVAQGTFGPTVLWWCGLEIEKARWAGSWYAAFLVFTAAAGVCQLAAGVMLLARRWVDARLVRGSQRWAWRSLVPVFLFGAAITVWAGIEAVRGTDMYAGAATAVGVIVCVITGVFMLLALAAARMLRPAAE